MKVSASLQDSRSKNGLVNDAVKVNAARIEAALYRVHYSTIWLIISDSFALAFLVSSGITIPFAQRKLPPQSVYYPDVLDDIAFFFVLSALFSIIWYIHGLVSGMVRKYGTDVDTVSAPSLPNGTAASIYSARGALVAKPAQVQAEMPLEEQ
jgi:hypothetical protein